MTLRREIIIVGGGLAGLTCAIHLRKNGHAVTLVEKSVYPRHKVCGEFISNEVRAYLGVLGIDIDDLPHTEIEKFSISSPSGRTISAALPLGGFGISRHFLDHYLFRKAMDMGCEMITDAVDAIDFRNDAFEITTRSNGVIWADLAIGAFGKRSSIDQKLKRRFFYKPSPWLAVKAHYRGKLDNDTVTLHNFEGGYCGLSKVEDDLINVCYLADYKTFKAYRNIEEFQRLVLCKNPLLKSFFERAQMISAHPLTISQVSFEKKTAVDHHVLMIGDTAGLINPLCGNGMAMAIHSAKLCAELCSKYINKEIESRQELEKSYLRIWKLTFQKRLFIGRILAGIVKKRMFFRVLTYLLAKFPVLLPVIIRGTHGKPII